MTRYRYVDPPMDAGPDLIDGTTDDAPLCGGTWSVYAGQPGGTALDPRAQLAEGWIKRVVRALNPFEARVQDFHAAETNTYASMLFQLGERYEGDIAFNPDAVNLNSIGLIEAYTTILRRGINLSIDGTPPIDYAPANQALLFVAARIADFYTLLGNEAYADAQDPMIGFGTGSGIYGTLAPTIFAFQNQLDSLLAEELALLRGRDNTNTNTSARPVYNRLYWNFTSGDGEFAYALAYNITDQNLDGNLNEFDARILFPQGHGDAWGHYLTAMTTYYSLLRHPFYTWLPRPEAVTVAGVPIQVDFLDERKFAKAAAAKARAGAEIVNLTYRSSYVEDPAGQWQGYKDTNPDRAWGLSEWGKRAGQGAYFDWVVGNAILPAVDPNPEHVGIQKVDRKSILELGEIVTQAQTIQAKVDEADRGLNPLGLAKGVVPFDIDPTFLDVGSNVQGQTHFEQVFKRAEKAFGNAVSTFNHANLLTELIRRTQDSSEEIYNNNFDQEIDYKNRLIEIYGYPYDVDIGPGGTYPSNYDGPDIYHYMYVDQSDLTGAPGAEAQVFTVAFNPLPAGIGFFDFDPHDNDPTCTFAIDPSDCSLADAPATTMNVSFSYAVPTRSSATAGAPDVADSFFLVKPPEWGSSQRRAPGNLQGKLSDLLLAMNSYQQALSEYDNLIADIQDAIDLLETQYDVKAEQINIMNGARSELQTLTALVETTKALSVALKRGAAIVALTFDTSLGLHSGQHHRRLGGRRRSSRPGEMRRQGHRGRSQDRTRNRRRRGGYRRQRDGRRQGGRRATGVDRGRDSGRQLRDSAGFEGAREADPRRAAEAPPGLCSARAGRRRARQLPDRARQRPAHDQRDDPVPQELGGRHSELSLPRHGVPHLPQRRVAEVPGAVRPRGALRLPRGDRLRLRDQPPGFGQRLGPRVPDPDRARAQSRPDHRRRTGSRFARPRRADGADGGRTSTF